MGQCARSTAGRMRSIWAEICGSDMGRSFVRLPFWRSHDGSLREGMGSIIRGWRILRHKHKLVPRRVSVFVCGDLEDKAGPENPKERQARLGGAPGGVRMSYVPSNQSTDVLESLISQFHSLIHSLCTPEAVLLQDSLSCIRRLFCIQRICRFGSTRN